MCSVKGIPRSGESIKSSSHWRFLTVWQFLPPNITKYLNFGDVKFRFECTLQGKVSHSSARELWHRSNRLEFFFFCGENAPNNKLNAATLHVYVYISSQCPNFDRQLWASVPTAASVTHCRPDCIFIQTQQLTATEFATAPPSLCLLKLFLPLTVSAITLLYISASPIPGDTVSPWEYIMGANVIISSISSRLYTFFSNFKTSYLTFFWRRGGVGSIYFTILLWRQRKQKCELSLGAYPVCKCWEENFFCLVSLNLYLKCPLQWRFCTNMEMQNERRAWKWQ